MSQPPRYFFMTLGYPGSGKTYVSRWIADLHHAVHLRGDDMRTALYGQNRLEIHTPDKTKQVYRAMCYAAKQVLASGYSVVQDANFNRQETRRSLAHMARKYGATPIVVWIQTPVELAKARVEQRIAEGGYALLEENLIEKMAKRLEQPTTDELVITIDGQLDAAKQQTQFVQALTAIETAAVQ